MRYVQTDRGVTRQNMIQSSNSLREKTFLSPINKNMAKFIKFLKIHHYGLSVTWSNKPHNWPRLRKVILALYFSDFPDIHIPTKPFSTFALSIRTFPKICYSLNP